MSSKRPEGGRRPRAEPLDGADVRWIAARVRAGLAWHIAHCAFLPPTLAASLARDVEADGAGQAEDGGSAGLSPAAAEAALAAAAEALLGELVERHGIPRHLAEEIALHGRERALLELLDRPLAEGGVEGLVDALASRGRLSASLILRALAEGRTRFAHTALARRAELARDEAAHLLQDLRGAGVAMVCRRAGIPVVLAPAFRAAAAALAEAGVERGPAWRRELARLLLDKVVMAYDDVSPTNLEHMMSQLCHRLATGGEDRHDEARGALVH
jgi:uncharacterized protein (DUF2336 family)